MQTMSIYVQDCSKLSIKAYKSKAQVNILFCNILTQHHARSTDNTEIFWLFIYQDRKLSKIAFRWSRTTIEELIWRLYVCHVQNANIPRYYKKK